MGSKWAHFTRLCTPNGLGCGLEKRVFDPFLPIFGPKTAHFQGILGFSEDQHGSNAIPRAPNPPATPHFLWFPPLRIAQTDARPQYLGPLGCNKLQAQAQTGGCPNGSTGSSRGKKMTFLKNDPRPCATLNKGFWTILSLWWPILVLRKSQKALKMGCFGTKKG